MSKLKIKYFGPIKEGFKQTLPDNSVNEWLDVKKVTVFIGNQGSGKSTVAKVITTMTWLEKAINRGDISEKEINNEKFLEYFKYMLTHNYFKNNTVIEYEGDAMYCLFKNDIGYPQIKLNRNFQYKVPKVMYIPAERNLLSIVKNNFLLKDLPESLITFAEELRKSHLALNGKPMELPLQNMHFKYDKINERSILIGENYQLDLKEASSGYHSLVPLFLVSKYLTDELNAGTNTLKDQLSAEQNIRRNKEVGEISFDSNLSQQEKEERIQEINSKYLNTCFINVVEELEQNLFPISQQKILNSLLNLTNRHIGNKLILTTHSPYLINYFALAVEGHNIKLNSKSSKALNKLQQIIPLDSTISSEDLVIYEMDETDGSIKILDSYKGIPADDNKLNYELGEGNEAFAKLLEIEQNL